MIRGFAVERPQQMVDILNRVEQDQRIASAMQKLHNIANLIEQNCNTGTIDQQAMDLLVRNHWELYDEP